MIDLYYWPTPNGWKLSIMLEECGLPYTVKPVNIGRGEQFDPAFLAISPNNRIPAMVDHAPPGGGAALPLFESGAMLQYLAEKTAQFQPADLAGRHAVATWLHWQIGGLGPMVGQSGHFRLYAPEQVPYAIDRYEREVLRLYGVLDRQLARTGAYVAGADYSIADIACFPWIMTHKKQQVPIEQFPNVQRWFATVRARPAVQRGLAVGRELGSPGKGMDEEARKHLFGSAPGAGSAQEPRA